MITLDEVIKAYEVCHASVLSCEGCPYDNGETWRDDDCYVPDALYYLKKLKRIEAMIEKIAIGNVEDTLSKMDNPPLTWDELKTLEGKPVWVDAESLPVGVSPYWKDWYIIKSFSNDEFMYCNDGFEWAKEMQGRLWQAYRKERC